MDRPKQAARSMRRMVEPGLRGRLDERLVVWQGPPPADLAKHHGLLLELCQAAGADTVVVDSLKDAAIGLSEDDVGAGYNRTRQTALAAGVQVVELHHNRKTQQGAAKEQTLDDLYGSTWLAAGAGSVVLLTGAPGDPVVQLRHLKQPVGEVGPLRIVHDHDRGRSQVYAAVDLVALTGAGVAMTSMAGAGYLFDCATPSAAQKEKARRKLDGLVRAGLLRVVEEGDRRTNRPTLYGVG